MSFAARLFTKVLHSLVVITLIVAPFKYISTVTADNGSTNTISDPVTSQGENGFMNALQLKDDPVPSLREQLAEQAAQAEAKEGLNLQLGIEPAIYIPGKPVIFSWSISGIDEYAQKNAELVLTFPEGSAPTDTALSDQVSKEHQLKFPLAELKLSSIEISMDDSVKFPIYLGATVFMDGEPVLGNSVYLDSTGTNATKGSDISVSGFDGQVSLQVASDSLAQDVIFDVRPPSPHALAGYSLSLNPVEIVAVDTELGKNVTSFKSPLLLQIQYDEKQIVQGDEADLQIYYFDDEAFEWFPMETKVDTEANIISTYTDHLTVFDYKAASWQGYAPPSLDSFQVSEFTGAGTYSMDLWTLPGTAGLQPVLSLSYNSQVFDEGAAFTQASWVGSGWSLNTGAIVRNMHGTNSSTTDDTFSINIGGISGMLLPIDANTFYTADQSFTKVIKSADSSSWTAYGRDGTVYVFGLASKTHTTSGCVASASSLNLIWNWALTSVTDIHGNTITYTHTQEVKSTSCANVIAVYPNTITYANGKYRVYFILESRNDYQAAWTTSASLVLFSKQRLKEIQIKYLPEGVTDWGSSVLSRKYVFSYSADTTNQILPSFKWRNLAYTATLVGVQEVDGSGNNLPATQFYYDDDMHLTKVDNGQGGQVEMTYQVEQFYDDVNDNERSIYVIIGSAGTECYDGTTKSPWTGVYNPSYVRCDPSTTPYSLQVGQDPSASGAHRPIPLYLIKPGARYNFWLQASPIQSPSSVEFSLIDTDRKSVV